MTDEENEPKPTISYEKAPAKKKVKMSGIKATRPPRGYDEIKAIKDAAREGKPV